MNARKSALVGFVQTGRWLTLVQLWTDGTFRSFATDQIVGSVRLEDVMFTKNIVSSAIANAGKRTRLDVVNSAGLALPAETGKGRGDVATMIRRRCGEDAETLIAAVEAQYTLEQAA